nr:signal peptidase complex catalytic subunit SEC11C [Tanacetum cinerariifolium]
MGFIGESIDSLKSMKIRQAAEQIITLGMIVSSALIIWKFLMVVTGSESPVVVVLSESMEPAFQRGDILFLRMGEDPIRAGEIVVFNIDRREIPIVHRVIKGIIMIRMTEFYMHLVSNGLSTTISWVEPWDSYRMLAMLQSS